MPELALSLHSVIGEASQRLRQAGVRQPRREALRMWTELSGGSLAEVVVDGHLPVEPTRAADFSRAIQRRASGEPLAHITGWTGFRHLLLRSDARALIPRPETEGLVELLLSRARTGVVADIGTGSGCIALSLAREGSFSRVVAVDCSSDALALARINARQADVSQVDFVRADLCSPLGSGSVNAVISNPPYLSDGEYAGLDCSVRDWEPRVALASGPDGLAVTTRLLVEARDVLQCGGWLALEVDCSRAADIARLAADRGWCELSIHMDLFGRERYLLARRSDTR